MPKYRIVAYLRVPPPEDVELFDSLTDADAELLHLTAMNNEDVVYAVEEVYEDS